MNAWYIVVDSKSRPRASTTAYRSHEHAKAVATSNDFEYPTLAPHRVVMLVELADVVDAAEQAQVAA